ncbi:MAG: hydrolase 1, exosortase A system-associated [Janthinobacterium lividum]
MSYTEKAIGFACGGHNLYGILSLPLQPVRRGVVMIVGGPQYRAGSHRQFTLLARHLASAGVPVLRFDYRGMGDSDGDQHDFEQVDSDVRAAIDLFMLAAPGLQEIVLWGLCDAASAAVFYAHQDARVKGLVLLNPWVRTKAGIARATLKHYYVRRLLQPAFWKKLFAGGLDLRASLASLATLLRASSAAATAAPEDKRHPDEAANPAVLGDVPVAGNRLPLNGGLDLPARLYRDLSRFDGAVLLICSAADLTAREFTDLAGSSPEWRRLMAQPRMTKHTLAGADHTFSSSAWRDEVALWTGTWLASSR